MKKLMMKLFLGIVVLIAFMGLFSIGVNAATKRKLTKTDIKIVSPINKIYDGDYKHAIVIYKKGVTGKILNRKYKAINGKLTNKKPLNVGKYEETITIKGTKKYKGKVKLKRKYTIKPRNIQKTDATITLPNNFQYDGNAKAVNVVFNHGMTGKAFINYSGNNLVNGKPIYPGIYKARVILQGTGNCKGSVTMDEVYYTIVDARAKNTSVVDNYVARFVPNDYVNWDEFINVVNSVKATTPQFELEKRISEVTGFVLIPKAVDMSVLNTIETALARLTESDYTAESYKAITDVIVAAKEIKLQSVFDAAVSKISLDTLVAKEIDTTVLNAIETELAKLVESDYTAESYKAITDVIATAKEIKLQSVFDAAVSKISLDTLVAKEIDTTVLNAIEMELAGLTESDYTAESYKAITGAIATAKEIKLQSVFDVTVSKISLDTLVAKEINTRALGTIETELAKLVESDYTAESYKAITDAIAAAKEIKLQSVFDAAVGNISLDTLVANPVDTSIIDRYIDTLVSTDYMNWNDLMSIVNSVKSELLQSKFNERVTEVTTFKLTKKPGITLSDIIIKFPTNLVYDASPKEVEILLKEGVTAEIEVNYVGDGLVNDVPINAGTYGVNVTVRGTGNFGGTLELSQIQFEILKAKYDTKSIKFEDKTFEYNPLMTYSIYVEGSPVEVTYEGNGQTEKGTFKVIAHFVCDDSNYEPIEDMEAYIIIQENDDIDEGEQPGGGDDIEEGPQKPPAPSDDDIIEEGEQRLPAAA